MPVVWSACVIITNVSGAKLPRSFHIETADRPRPVKRLIAVGPPKAAITSPTVSSESVMAPTITTRREVCNHVDALLDDFPVNLENGGMTTPRPHPQSRTEIARRFRMMRAAIGLNQLTLATRCKISQQQLSQYENPDPAKSRIPELAEALKIKGTTGFGLDWIYDGDFQDVPDRYKDRIAELDDAPPAFEKPPRKARRKSKKLD